MMTLYPMVVAMQDGQTAIDVGSEADDVKEALLAYRFSGEEAEDEYLQERIPALVERALASSKVTIFPTHLHRVLVTCRILRVLRTSSFTVFCP